MRQLLSTVLLAVATGAISTSAFGQTCNTADRSVLLILDASGSMNAKLPNGETRIAVAQRAVKGVATYVPARAQLSLRMYGAQSPASDKNCRDTHLAVPFGAAGAASGPITNAVDGAKAQGYTPIAYSLEQAQGDFPADAKERVIVLVSDGKETCRGDPLLAARGLGAKGITIHTVGFIADTAARMQLQNIARATGGAYFDAPIGPELPDRLKTAFEACKQVARVPPKPQPGKLRTTAATWLRSHPVFNVETGHQVGDLTSAKLELSLPAGIYEVQFGGARWKGIEVRGGETTVISPAVLQLDHISGNSRVLVVDSETGEQHGDLNRMSNTVAVMPGLYDLRWGGGGLVWPFVKVDGETKLPLARVVMSRELKWNRARVLDAQGKALANLYSAVDSGVGLPPGDYTVDVDGNKYPFKAEPGGVLEIKP